MINHLPSTPLNGEILHRHLLLEIDMFSLPLKFL